jgi:hypothetical protein
MTFVCFSFVMNAQTTKTHKVNSFTSISIANGVDLYITQGNTHNLKIEATDEQHENIKIKNSGGNLKVEYKGKWIQNKAIKVYVTIRNLENLAASGGADIYMKGDFKTEKLFATITGGSDLEIGNLDATTVNFATSGGSDIEIEHFMVDKLTMTVSGGSDIDISAGSCNKMNAVVSGGSDVDAKGFKVENCTITVSGGSDATIHVNGKLNLVASGASDITCLGKPTNVTKTVSKSSDVEIL